MKTLIILLFSLPLYSQTYVGIYGGTNGTNIGIKADVRQEFENNLGARANFYYDDHRGRDIFSLQVSYTVDRNSFYTPVLSSGVEFNDGIRPLLSLENMFRIEDYFKVSLGVDTNFEHWFYNVGVVIRFDLIDDPDFKPRFF